jgi:Uma2 family endonuclease
MVTLIHDGGSVSVPEWVVDIDSFRRWSDSKTFPQKGYTWFLKGEVWVDRSKEQIFSHVQVKTEVTIVLGGLVKAQKLGLFLTDGLLFSNVDADISGNPDATFISQETLQSDRVRLIEGVDGGYVELEGSPDMVLEIVSDSSAKKDRITLRKAYWESNIPEYWIIDARKSPASLEILRSGSKGYSVSRKQDGWMKSNVFGRHFQLSESQNRLGHREFALMMKEIDS